MRDACEEIASRWASISPPDDYDGRTRNSSPVLISMTACPNKVSTAQVEMLAIISDHRMAKVAYLQAVADCPNARITMPHGARIIEQTHRDRA